jgi:fructose/tagatose bisphosphate aldolase
MFQIHYNQPIEFQAQEFIVETGIDALAVCIGNVHGKYPASGPNLRLDLLKVKYIHIPILTPCSLIIN